jgi:HSP20 family protein
MMTLVKFNQHAAVPSFVDRFFHGDPFGLSEQIFNQAPFNTPAVNIRETSHSYEVELAVPGRKRDDFKVSLHENVLTISGEARSEKEARDEQGKYTRLEFGVERFERSFNLPDQINDEKIGANYQDGVLKISIPKMEEAKKQQPRTIDIF